MKNKRKSEVLGMPFGTASGRLRKMILFHLAQKLNEDRCYQCGKPINTVEEFSIEHKIPWRNNSDLFWDLENIAFSHLDCNRPENERYRKLSPEGYSWCNICKEHKSVDQFSRGPRWNRLNPCCRSCHSDKHFERMSRR